jgi:hypothetical protein
VGLGDRYGLTREYSMEAIGVVSEVFRHVLIGWLPSLQSTIGLVGRRHALSTHDHPHLGSLVAVSPCCYWPRRSGKRDHPVTWCGVPAAELIRAKRTCAQPILPDEDDNGIARGSESQVIRTTKRQGVR